MNTTNQLAGSFRNRRAGLGAAIRSFCVALVAGFGISGAASAGFLTVPNGDFSAAANAGTVGGGVVGASGTDVVIGSGPWTGTYAGVVGLLIPPTLTIDAVAGTATVTGLLGVAVVSIVNNSGHFGQTLAANTQSNKRYTLIANLETGATLDLPLLAVAGTGVELIAGASTLVQSTTAPAGQARADALDATTLRLQIHHDTGTVTPAPLRVQLFDRPQNLLTASLVDTAVFSGVQLAESTIPGGNSTLTVTGGGSQGTPIGQPFPSSMTAIVRDQNGNPIPDTLVTLTAPAEGASATLHAGSQSGRVIVAFTDANGQITFTADANQIAGCYNVTGEVPGIPTMAIFRMRNYTTQQIAAYMAANPGAKGLPQDSVFCNGFE
ncbi:MAG TPA: hypothetical protein VLF18_10400 [Tahibacter sp.]|uniref:hypothetical protein n=1 Tax=Tahibacter sp. TaxID=2056211 RepID=UPI002B91E843|nr:hypothetical protein [Tahibacter sp.]HSX60599.1 hypothetical protein [Tahibacter sp.]